MMMSGHIPFLDSPINGVYEANSDRQALKSGPLGDDASQLYHLMHLSATTS